MAGNRTLKLSILADVDDLKKKLGQGEKEVEGFGNKLGEFGKKAAAAFAVAAAAAAVYAGKLLIDGVKAAVEDEKAQINLAKTLQNTTGATKDQIKAVEDQILKMSLATGVSDDKLRPSFEKLVRATSDVTKAQELQTLALDIAAGSGKDLETVSAALAKAYDGNNGALGRLGVGLSTAELKSMSLEDVTNSLAKTFGGQALAQAETFSGKMDRMKVAFDEAKESVGARLLPILTQLLDAFNTKVGPAVEAIKDKLKPLTKAIDDNKEEFQALWNFLNKYIVPIMTGALSLAFSGIVTTIKTLVTIVGKAVSFFEDLYSAYKKFIDFIKNNPLSNFVGKLNPFGNASFSNTGFLTAGGAGIGTGGVDELGRPLGGTTDDNVDAATENKRRNTMWKSETIMRDSSECPSGKGVYLVEYNYYGEVIRQSLNYCVPLIGQNNITSGAGTGVITATGSLTGSTAINGTTTSNPIVINVNAPSAIDEEGFTRAVVLALNTSNARNGGGGAILGGLVAQ